MTPTQPPSGQPSEPPPEPSGRPATPPSGQPDGERPAVSSSAEANQAWRSFAYLLSGPLVYGGAGWLLDRWLGTSFLLPLGIVGGMALSLYLIWFRYGTH